ncbi:kinase-like domain-containing protein [Corynascus novoguineensis]|uniref:Kinase-like domain-containing protein n=1 Tax=Corynascus novoguineensis TaxID=1126955 RepID=A0AAN7HI85_9PEZI|nr:kinase-like domain-containing protein [Corynascus novoguineensis]
MPSAFTIPYFLPPEFLPAPLPSTEEIEAQDDISPKYHPGQHVARVGKHFVVKHGWLVHPSEGQNMLYVREKTCVPVPRVYAIYQQEDANGRNCTYIVMEYVGGRALKECWGALGVEDKEAIAFQLRGYFDQLRGLPSPDDRFGSLENGPLRDGLFMTDEEQPAINGPFDSETEIAEALVLKLEQDGDDFKPEKAAFFRHVLPRVLQGDGKPTFTHGDLNTTNLMLRPDGTVVVLDWQTAGWYPRYWEYAIATFGCGWWVDDFHAWIPKFLDEYPNEYLWLATIRTFLWY